MHIEKEKRIVLKTYLLFNSSGPMCFSLMLLGSERGELHMQRVDLRLMICQLKLRTLAGMRLRFWPNTGSGALYLKLREIFKSLLNEYAR